MSTYGSSTFARPPGPPNTNFQYQYHSPDGNAKWKGPRRVCIFCALAMFLPSLLISVPLLMRFVIYGSHSYVIHPSDMRVLDHRISTAWCQGESIHANTSFTAYVTNGEPELVETPTSMSLDQQMKIPDDHKEYWGLYLLPGSTFRIKTCARHKGGTLLIVRGNKHMEYCAYIGENDSAGNSDQVSSSTSVETMRKHVGKNGGAESKEGHPSDDLTILSKLKNFLQSHPDNKDRIQKTLEDWMLLNATRDQIISTETNKTVDSIGVQTDDIETTTEDNNVPTQKGDSIEHGTIHRRRRALEVRRNTESGEDGAFEDESVNENDTLLPLGIARKNMSKSFHPAKSIWKEEHGHHSGVFNQSLGENDGSGSESESSFSSSEEALLKCEGIIASFNLPQDEGCISEGVFEDLHLTKNLSGLASNVYEFQVKERDYYYFIFGSENEKQTNLIRTKFELEKVEYQLPEPVENCTDVEECQISFRFASWEKVVIKLPQPLPSSNSNMIYVAETDCKPRALLYLIFVILVPLVILMFAFQ